VAAKAGRLTPREATMSCWRRNAFSAISSARDRVRSATTPSATPDGRYASRSAVIARAATLEALAANWTRGCLASARSERIRDRSSSLFCGESQATVWRRRGVASTASHRCDWSESETDHQVCSAGNPRRSCGGGGKSPAQGRLRSKSAARPARNRARSLMVFPYLDHRPHGICGQHGKLTERCSGPASPSIRGRR
jgi:hypothetical protein